MTFSEAVDESPQDPVVQAASPQPRTSDGRAWIAGCAVAAAFFAVLADAAPTGTTWWDAVLRASVAVAFTFAAAATSWRLSAIGAGLAALAAGGIVPLIAALGGFISALGRPFSRDTQREMGALSGALTVQALLRLRPGGFFGLASIIAGVVFLVVLVAGYRKLARPRRRSALIAALAVFVVAAIAVGVAALSASPIRASADAGIEAAREGLDLARAGDAAGLTSKLEQAESQLSDASDQLGSARFAPLKLIPVVAQHHRAVSTAARQGAVVAAQGVAVARDADIDQLQLRQGQFDLNLLASMAPQLDAAASSLDSALVAIEADRSPWLVSVVDDPLGELVDEITEVLPEARLSAAAARVMPDMLGGLRGAPLPHAVWFAGRVA